MNVGEDGNTLSLVSRKLESMFFGGIVAAILFGCSTVQTIVYFQYRTRDSPGLKAMICILWFLAVLHLALLIYCLYHYLIANFSNGAALREAVWSIICNIFITELMCYMVSVAYAWRVYTLSGRKWAIPTFLVIIRTPCLVFSFYFAIRSFQLKQFETINSDRRLVAILYTGFSLAAAYDALITLAMCYYLRRAHQSAGSNRLDNAISGLMMYAFNSGAIVFVCQLLVLITYAVNRENFAFIAVYVTIPDLYMNALLASLNARESLRVRAAGAIACSFPVFRGEEESVSHLPSRMFELEQQPVRFTVAYSPENSITIEDSGIMEVCRDSKSVRRLAVAAEVVD